MTKYATNKNKPSLIFIESLEYAGQHDTVCNCGRQHYCPDSSSLWQGDSECEGDHVAYLANALEEQAEDPDGVVIHYDIDYVGARKLNGGIFVLECPCNGLHKYEQFVWQGRNEIRKYLKTRIEQEHKWAQEELTLNKIAGI